MKELLTERLRLRGWRESDIDDLVALNTDPEVMRFIRAPGSPAAERAKAAAWIEKYQDRELGLWAIEGRADGGFHGFALLQALPGTEARTEAFEIGYRLPKPSWGRGIATEAARRLRDYGFEAVSLEEIVAVTHPENQASQHVLAKLGLKFQGLRRAYEIEGLHYFALSKNEWQRLKADTES